MSGETIKGTVIFAEDLGAGIIGTTVEFDTGLLPDDFRDPAMDVDVWRTTFRRTYSDLHDWPCEVIFSDECQSCGNYSDHAKDCPDK